MGQSKEIVVVNWLPHAFCLLVTGLFLTVFLSLCTSAKSRKEKKGPTDAPPLPAEKTEEASPKLSPSHAPGKAAGKAEYCTFNIDDFRSKSKKKPPPAYMQTAMAIESKKIAMETAVEKPQSVMMMTAMHDPNTSTNKWTMATAAEGGTMATAAEGAMATAMEGDKTTAAQPLMKTAMFAVKTKSDTGTTEDDTEGDDDEVAVQKKKGKPKQRRK